MESSRAHHGGHGTLYAGWTGAEQALVDAQWEEIVDRAARGSLPEFLDLLSIPNDSIIAADVEANALWVEGAFKRRGFTTQLLPNNGRPLVYAEYLAGRPGAGTLLFYMHFDGQPVEAEQWSQESPWIPVVKQRGTSGEWKPVASDVFRAPELDPELRVFARSAADDKGPIMIFLAAFDAMREAGAVPAMNVKVVLDSEEERNSPNLSGVVTAHRDLFRADALVVHDGPMHESGRPTLIFGNRGLVTATLTVFGPRTDLHSGKFGNYAPNPALRLAALLASMKDDDGRVTIPGYYDGVELSEKELAILAEAGDDEPAIRRQAGIACNEPVGASYQESHQYPSLNIRGLAAGAIGERASSIIPSVAIAELDIRTTPEMTAECLLNLVEDHIRSRGYHLVDGEPTDEERAVYGRIASFRVNGTANAAMMPVSSPIGNWASRALGAAPSRPPVQPVRIRMMGATAPTGVIVEKLDLPFVIVPLVNPDNNQHSPDENLRIGHYVNGIKTVVALLRTPYP